MSSTNPIEETAQGSCSSNANINNSNINNSNNSNNNNNNVSSDDNNNNIIVPTRVYRDEPHEDYLGCGYVTPPPLGGSWTRLVPLPSASSFSPILRSPLVPPPPSPCDLMQHLGAESSLVSLPPVPSLEGTPLMPTLTGARHAEGAMSPSPPEPHLSSLPGVLPSESNNNSYNGGGGGGGGRHLRGGVNGGEGVSSCLGDEAFAAGATNNNNNISNSLPHKRSFFDRRGGPLDISSSSCSPTMDSINSRLCAWGAAGSPPSALVGQSNRDAEHVTAARQNQIPPEASTSAIGSSINLNNNNTNNNNNNNNNNVVPTSATAGPVPPPTPAAAASSSSAATTTTTTTTKTTTTTTCGGALLSRRRRLVPPLDIPGARYVTSEECTPLQFGRAGASGVPPPLQSADLNTVVNSNNETSVPAPTSARSMSSLFSTRSSRYSRTNAMHGGGAGHQPATLKELWPEMPEDMYVSRERLCIPTDGPKRRLGQGKYGDVLQAELYPPGVHAPSNNQASNYGMCVSPGESVLRPSSTTNSPQPMGAGTFRGSFSMSLTNYHSEPRLTSPSHHTGAGGGFSTTMNNTSNANNASTNIPIHQLPYCEATAGFYNSGLDATTSVLVRSFSESQLGNLPTPTSQASQGRGFGAASMPAAPYHQQQEHEDTVVQQATLSYGEQYNNNNNNEQAVMSPSPPTSDCVHSGQPTTMSPRSCGSPSLEAITHVPFQPGGEPDSTRKRKDRQTLLQPLHGSSSNLDASTRGGEARNGHHASAAAQEDELASNHNAINEYIAIQSTLTQSPVPSLYEGAASSPGSAATTPMRRSLSAGTEGMRSLASPPPQQEPHIDLSATTPPPARRRGGVKKEEKRPAPLCGVTPHAPLGKAPSAGNVRPQIRSLLEEDENNQQQKNNNPNPQSISALLSPSAEGLSADGLLTPLTTTTTKGPNHPLAFSPPVGMAAAASGELISASSSYAGPPLQSPWPPLAPGSQQPQQPSRRPVLPQYSHHPESFSHMVLDDAIGMVAVAAPFRSVAVKKIRKIELNKAQSREALRNELHMASQINHPCLVNIFGVAEDHDNVYLVMDLAENGNMYEYQQKFGIADAREMAPRFLADVVLALEYFRDGSQHVYRSGGECGGDSAPPQWMTPGQASLARASDAETHYDATLQRPHSNSLGAGTAPDSAGGGSQRLAHTVSSIGGFGASVVDEDLLAATINTITDSEPLNLCDIDVSRRSTGDGGCDERDHRHSMILHRDIKPDNLLMTWDYHVKVGDFGTACFVGDEEANRFAGTAEYISPEMITTNGAVAESDLWALGCVLYFLLEGKTPFHASTQYMTQRNVKNYKGAPLPFSDDVSAEARDLVSLLLQPAPADRIGSEAQGGLSAIRDHPFFADIDWSCVLETTNITPTNTNYTAELSDYLLDGEEVCYCSPVEQLDASINTDDDEDDHSHSKTPTTESIASGTGRGSHATSVMETHCPMVLVLTSAPRLFLVDPESSTVAMTIPWTRHLHVEVERMELFTVRAPPALFAPMRFKDTNRRADLWGIKVNEMVAKHPNPSSMSAAAADSASAGATGEAKSRSASEATATTTPTSASTNTSAHYQNMNTTGGKAVSQRSALTPPLVLPTSTGIMASEGTTTAVGTPHHHLSHSSSQHTLLHKLRQTPRSARRAGSNSAFHSRTSSGNNLLGYTASAPTIGGGGGGGLTTFKGLPTATTSAASSLPPDAKTPVPPPTTPSIMITPPSHALQRSPGSLHALSTASAVAAGGGGGNGGGGGQQSSLPSNNGSLLFADMGSSMPPHAMYKRSSNETSLLSVPLASKKSVDRVLAEAERGGVGGLRRRKRD